MNTNMRAVIGFVFAAALAACGGSSESAGSGSVSGKVSGTPIKVSTAISTTETMTPGGTIANVIITDAADACTEAMGDVVHPNQQVILIELGDSADGMTFTAPTAAAMYMVPAADATSAPAHTAFVVADLADSQCNELGNLDDDTASSGSVTLTKVDGTAYTGTFNVTLGTGDVLTGSFDSDECDIGSGSGSGTCK